MKDNLRTIQDIYDCFSRSDLDGILEHLDPDIRWDADWARTPPPLYAPRVGRDKVPGFFEKFVAEFDFVRFEPQEFLAGGDWVAVPVEYELLRKSTGERVADLEVHLWRLGADGKVVWFRHMLDARLFE